MDLNSYSTGDKIIAGCGLALLILAFFPWFSANDGLLEGRAGGFGNPFSALAILIGIAMAVIVILKNRGTNLPDLPWPMVMLGAGAAAVVLVILQLIVGGSVSAGGFTLDLDPAIGVWLGLLASAGLAGGAFLNYQEGDNAPSGGGGAPPTTF